LGDGKVWFIQYWSQKDADIPGEKSLVEGTLGEDGQLNIDITHKSKIIGRGTLRRADQEEMAILDRCQDLQQLIKNLKVARSELTSIASEVGAYIADVRRLLRSESQKLTGFRQGARVTFHSLEGPHKFMNGRAGSVQGFSKSGRYLVKLDITQDNGKDEVMIDPVFLMRETHAPASSGSEGKQRKPTLRDTCGNKSNAI